MSNISWQARVLNALLKTTIKSRLFPTDERPIALQNVQRRVRAFEKLLPAPNARITPIRLSHCDAEWVVTPSHSDRVILYFHGGAYATCSPKTHRDLTAALSQFCRARVLVPDYRQGPHHVFPAWLEDAIDAYQYLLDQGIKPSSIILAGDSAGGNLVISTLVKLRDKAMPLPKAAICISPWVDLGCTGDSFFSNADAEAMLNPDGIKMLGKRAAGGAPLNEPLLSPVFADLSQLPPLHIQVGDAEILLSDAQRLRDNAESAGVQVEYIEWQNLPHVFQAFVRFIPEAKQSLSRIANFLDHVM